MTATDKESTPPPTKKQKTDGKQGVFSKKNEHGLEYIKLVHANGSTAEIYLYGGVVTSYKDSGGIEYIAIRPDAKMDGSKPISGGLSHCWPQFGPGKIQQHGFARNVTWTFVEDDDKATTESPPSCVLKLSPNEYTKKMWDHDFVCTFTVTLQEDQLDTKLVVENTSSSSSTSSQFEFQAALHSYFQCTSLKNIHLTGSFQDQDYVNRVGGKAENQKETRSSITIDEEYDRIYKGVHDATLHDSGTGKSLEIINSSGWVDTVVWNPYGNEKMGYDKFVCVESVKFDPVTLEAGKSWEGVMSLKPK